MPSIIKNKKQLGTTKLRRDALEILSSGLRAIQIPNVLKKSITLNGDLLRIKDSEIDLKAFNNIYVVGIGKAAFEAGKYLDSLFGNKIKRGVILDIKKGDLKNIEYIVGTHPLPSKANIDATKKIIQMVSLAKKDDLVLIVVSGGGSALLCNPHDLTCNEMIVLTQELLECGASIEEINTLRKHTSGIQGGRLATLAAPATVIGLIFSDVPGDKIETVASGPTTLDTTTNKEARAVLKKYDLLKKCRLKTCNLVETPKAKTKFSHVSNILLLTNKTALGAMKTSAEELGYKTNVLKKPIVSEAKKTGAKLQKLLKSKTALIAGGETFVKVVGKGSGGRNQETALSALNNIKAGELILSCASDGIDNTDVAGAIADLETKRKAKKLKLDLESTIQNNDSYNFFKQTKDQIKTGPTGTNVSDIFLGLKK